MSLKQSYYRYRVTFAKTGKVRFIGHLDLQDLFQKAIKRAKLPVGYSEGFNPHQLLSFACPLPLGMAGHAEMLEVFLTQEVLPQEIVSVLNSQMPQGLTILSAEEVPSVGKSAAALVRSATYSICFSQAVDVRAIMASDRIEVMKKGKQTDIRPDIHDLSSNGGNCIIALLACGSERNLKPEVLAEYISPGDNDVSYERLAIHLKGVGS